jgi:[FeFe] hydrogenase H-cluster maturation GTPase HydF
MKRINIGIFGRVNSGKSTLMNLLTQQYFSIVDSTPGTTTDVKTTIMEIHDFSPVKIFDTAGIDEGGELGSKKKEKSLDTLKKSDIVLLVINESNKNYADGDYNSEKEIIELAQKRKKEIFIIFNQIASEQGWYEQGNKQGDEQGNKQGNTGRHDDLPVLLLLPRLDIDLSKKENYKKLIEFIIKNSKLKIEKNELLPPLEKDKVVFLNIPMDDETPEGRFLRPQMMIEEHLVRRFIPTFAYRMDLGKARSKDLAISERERERFVDFIKYLKQNDKLQLLITDSQAMDIIAPWTKDLNINITTFSIVMINFLSNGQLKLFVEGVKAFSKLKKGDKVMIAEGCNHDRKAEDIGTVQIPNKIEEIFGKDSIQVDHYFGRVFAQDDKLKEYKLIIHCGGCMLDSQVIKSRIDDLVESGVSFTNFGVLLSYFQGEENLNRVIKPYGLSI